MIELTFEQFQTLRHHHALLMSYAAYEVFCALIDRAYYTGALKARAIACINYDKAFDNLAPTPKRIAHDR